MTWQLKSHVDVIQNAINRRWYARVLITDGLVEECVSLKFQHVPTPSMIRDAVQSQIDARNFVPPVTDEDRLAKRIEQWKSDGKPVKKLLDKLAELDDRVEQ